jgi:hypothetical protein
VFGNGVIQAVSTGLLHKTDKSCRSLKIRRVFERKTAQVKHFYDFETDRLVYINGGGGGGGKHNKKSPKKWIFCC